jgi:hypothetical protein
MPEHLGALGAVYKKMFGKDAAITAVILAKQNIRAVSERYPEDKDGERPGPQLKDSEIILQSSKWAKFYEKFGLPPFSKGDIENMVACYRYQSEEASDWERSEASAIIKQIADNLDNSPFPDHDNIMVEWEWKERY